MRFKEKMERKSGVSVTPEELEEKIQIVNRKTRTLARFFDFRKADPPPVSGKDALLVSQIAYYDDPERFTTKVNVLCDELEKKVQKGMDFFDITQTLVGVDKVITIQKMSR